MKNIIRLISLILALSMLMLTGCASANVEKATEGTENGGPAENLSGKVTAEKLSHKAGITKTNKAHYYGFSADLFRQSCASGKNTLISPLSVYFALAMLTNGAEGNTLAELESTLGMSRDDLNEFVYAYMKDLKSDYASLSIANSVWFDRGAITVADKFLQANANFFSADVFASEFNERTVKEVNDWISEKTGGMIENALEQLSPESVMLLINALYFESEWADPYSEFSVHEGTFTAVDGTKEDVEFMYSTESCYLEDENTTGFVKYYNGNEYAFVALLPNKGVSISSYVDDLDGEKIMNLFATMRTLNVRVNAKLPKFSTECSEESMINSLETMGIRDVFSPTKADLSSICKDAENLYVGQVIHKTNILVDEAGSKAGAVTILDIKCGSAPAPVEIEYKDVTLDRPFVYMIVDCKHDMPLFMGVARSIGETVAESSRR